MYKLIAIDMDGTLLNSNGKISDENIFAIKRALDKGVKVVFTTGRGIKAITNFLKEVGLSERDEYAITNNGVALYKTNNLKCLKANLLCGDELKKLVDLGIALNAKILVYDYKTEETIVLEENEFSAFERDHIGMIVHIKPNFPNEINNETKAFKIIYTEEPSKLDIIQKNIPDYIRENYTVVRSLPICLELFHKASNKGNAIRDLSNIFGISKEEVICIGDQQNDIEMIEYAGLGIAMGNAIDKLKEIANYVTDTNDNHGVAKAINKFIL
ncbi:Cof-type HAD-IIB family hydrolase [Candidatus Arthromitus sp. SFB-rat-Yit]|uniref:Cof-type HAD-IIB family hydrolase n=1 Tax=Candidatus Arthromitus sp. SFB-rat-Yit TaxID=1041504 RepID=UPI000227A660|nr:Cof-type HAD-IIB family hydrolase [Candidatus Arthromitus sp. SFB-rat-Yit]BAK81079.1 Cof-like hydrolase [Candidatus Arthromitus sp. SFB-rat-Yit]